MKGPESFLRQNYTWSQLRISEELLRKLFTRLKVHPDFLEVLLSFGEKIGPVEESFGSFFSHCHRQQQENRHINMVCSYSEPALGPQTIASARWKTF